MASETVATGAAAGPGEPLIFSSAPRWQRRFLAAFFVFAGLCFLFISGQILWEILDLLLGATLRPTPLRGTSLGLSGFLRPSLPDALFLALAGFLLVSMFTGFLVPLLVIAPQMLGTFYLYPDRLSYRFLRWTRHIYFSGTERVGFNIWQVWLRREGVRMILPYRMPDFVRLHYLLCERSEAYRRRMAIQFPYTLATLRRWTVALWLTAMALGTYVYADSRPDAATLTDAQALWDSVGGVVALVLGLGLAPLLLALLPAWYRFDDDHIAVRQAFREKRYEVSAIRDISSASHGSLEITFTDAKLTISQTMVRYPVSVLAKTLRERYLPPPQ